MPFQKGNKLWSRRKTYGESVQARAKELIDGLVVDQIVDKELLRIKKEQKKTGKVANFDLVNVVMPMKLKGMKDKQEVSSTLKVVGGINIINPSLPEPEPMKVIDVVPEVKKDSLDIANSEFSLPIEIGEV